jgi:hypothetical protein
MSFDQGSDAPAEAFQVVARVADGLAARRAYWTPHLMRENPDSSALVFPHRVASISINDLPAQGNQIRITVVAWRWVFRGREGRFIGSAEASIVDDGFRFGRINEGPYDTSFEEGLRRAAELGFKLGEYEPMLLTVPALNVVALLLKRVPVNYSYITRSDGIIVLKPAPVEFKQLENPELENFVRTLRDLTTRVSTRPRTGG